MTLQRAALAAALVAALACAGPKAETASRPAAAAPLAAAAGQAQAPAAKPAGAKDDLVCTMEKPVGTNIARRVCRRQEDVDTERAATQDDLWRATQQSSKQKSFQ